MRWPCCLHLGIVPIEVEELLCCATARKSGRLSSRLSWCVRSILFTWSTLYVAPNFRFFSTNLGAKEPVRASVCNPKSLKNTSANLEKEQASTMSKFCLESAGLGWDSFVPLFFSNCLWLHSLILLILSPHHKGAHMAQVKGGRSCLGS